MTLESLQKQFSNKINSTYSRNLQSHSIDKIIVRYFFWYILGKSGWVKVAFTREDNTECKAWQGTKVS